MSQQTMATALDIDRWTVAAIETGLRHASFDMAEAIESFTGGKVAVIDLVHPDIAKRLKPTQPERAAS